MKFLIIGLGSMGKRRIRCLLSLGIPTQFIFGFDLRSDRTEQAHTLYQIKTFHDFSEINLSLMDAWIISTPPDLHMHYAILGAQLNKHLFIEASVIDEGMHTLQNLLTQNHCVVFPSCTMRFFPGPTKINRLLRERPLGKIYSWQYQSGQYLPDWHPWETIQDFYVSRKETGGCREIVPFELSWLTQTFGPVKNIKAHQGQLGNFSADIDDIYLLQIEHTAGVFGQLLVDVLSRAPVRHMRVTAEKGSLVWDDSTHTICLNTIAQNACNHEPLIPQWETILLDQGTAEKFYINPEEPYQKEIQAFLDCIEQKKFPDYTLTEDQAILNLLYLAETNAKQTISF